MNLKGEIMKTEYLLNQEVERVLSALTPTNQLVVKVMLHTGLRVGDVLKLKKAELSNQFWIEEEKTKKRRRVGLTDELLHQMKSASPGSEYVFASRLDFRKPRTRQAVWADVKRASRAFRMKQNVAPHSFRKCYSVELLKKYGDLDRVKRALNHSSPTVTMIYAMADKLLEVKKKK